MTLDLDLPPERGDIVPHVSFKTGAGGELDIWDDDIAGSFLIMVFCGRDAGAADALISEIASKRGTLKAMGAKCLAVATRAEGAPRSASEAPFQLVIDPEGAGYKAFGLSAPRGSVVDAAPSLFLVAPNMHLLSAPDGEGGPRLDTVFADMRRWADRRRPFPSVIHPPALFVPDVLSREDCAWLREVYDTEGQDFVEPGHMALEGRTTDAKMRIPEYGREDRVDHWVVDPDTQAFIDDRLSRRLFPEIQKAFQYRISKHERYRIATYEGERGGEPHGHRDNSTAQVAYRRFAVTINLNAEEYDGGELRFPEFSEQLYKPASGMAIAFSCSLLHEVMHMRRGRRYALLAFVFGDV
jgi:predicted 2-oxoglutarate/Fe(II)-dependent dioxygenase YbiX